MLYFQLFIKGEFYVLAGRDLKIGMWNKRSDHIEENELSSHNKRYGDDLCQLWLVFTNCSNDGWISLQESPHAHETASMVLKLYEIASERYGTHLHEALENKEEDKREGQDLILCKLNYLKHHSHLLVKFFNKVKAL